jgi:hypothetical protein
MLSTGLLACETAVGATVGVQDAIAHWLGCLGSALLNRSAAPAVLGRRFAGPRPRKLPRGVVTCPPFWQAVAPIMHAQAIMIFDTMVLISMLLFWESRYLGDALEHRIEPASSSQTTRFSLMPVDRTAVANAEHLNKDRIGFRRSGMCSRFSIRYLPLPPGTSNSRGQSGPRCELLLICHVGADAQLSFPQEVDGTN